ncbi:chemotaxis protein CheW [Halodesulfovibrio aestuarii]|uniref:histidine kinase n=1 Tax=Halodesulfovibrio aestuarii TaxID=126333 RepID=A0A8G2C8D8_9BACT|nr:chemotaxis protein CheW [Halodesulfovibrio aestuarii]SHI67331.1 CheW-like domain-containing protein [Halodesulfovibrio aestuarii]
MLDDTCVQRGSVADYQNHSGPALHSAQASFDAQLYTMSYVRLRLQSDLASETPASIFAAQEEQGTVFYLPELTFLPTLDEYTVGERYLQYHVLVISPLACSAEPSGSVFDSLGSAEFAKLGTTGDDCCKNVTDVFSQYFLSAIGRGQADFAEISEELRELLQPLFVAQDVLQSFDVLPNSSCQSEDVYRSDGTVLLPVDDASEKVPVSTGMREEALGVVSEPEEHNSAVPMSDLECSNAPRVTDTMDVVPSSILNESRSGYLASVCDQRMPFVESGSLRDSDPSLFAAGSKKSFEDSAVLSACSSVKPFSCRKRSCLTPLQSTQDEDKLDRLISHVSELSRIQSNLYDYALAHDDDRLRSMADEFDRLYSVLRDSALELRMVSLNPLLFSVKDWVEDFVQSMDKQLLFTLEGGDVQVDAVIAEQVTDALATYFSTAILPFFDDEILSISLSVEYSGTDILLVMEHSECAIQGSEENVIISEALLRLQAEILALHGGLAVECGDQSLRIIKVCFPVTQAMIEGLVVQCGEEQYIVPMNQVAECIDCSPRMGVEIKEDKVVLGGETVPYVRLREYVDIDGKTEHEQCVVIQSLSGTFGLIVDGVVGELQAAIKPVGALYKHVEMISGVSVKSDGIPCLVLNLQHLQMVADCLVIT